MKTQKITLATSLMLSLLGGCSMNMGRSYLNEMENDDSKFFAPKDDFPVMSGDSGRFWNSDKQVKARTPASVHDVEENNYQAFLKHELRELESSQSEGASRLYEAHKHKFGSASEKIYFLKLPTTNRTSYLESRGFLVSRAAPETERRHPVHSRRSSNTLLGMSKMAVRQNWGSPVRVEVAGNPSNENERWAYNIDGATKYIYFESGVVEGYE